MNVILVFIYLITTITSLFTIVQSFSLYTVLSFILNFVFLIYMSHTLFRDSRIWREYSFSKSPFNELTNDWYFSAIVILTVFLLLVNLISTVVINGVVVSILDSLYYILLGRFIFLYREYLDKKKLDSNNDGNFDEVREKVLDVSSNIADKVVEMVDNKDDLEDKKSSKKTSKNNKKEEK